MSRSLFGLALAVLLVVAGNVEASAGCGPFGDPSAEVGRGVLSSVSPFCFGAKLMGPWRDPSGTDRYACLYEPESAGKDNPLPLVVFLHGARVTADSIIVTGLPGYVGKAKLGAKTPGFILIAPEGRYITHFYPWPEKRSSGWDNWYRQLGPPGKVDLGTASYEENADAAAIDHFIAAESATGKVDPRRIYLMGWSNGAAMAILYALNRPEIAAAAVYSAPDPFGAFDDPCKQTPVGHPPASPSEVPVRNPRVPLMHVRNSCDIAGLCPNGDRLAAQLRALGTGLDDVILDSSEKRAAACDDSCGSDPNAGGAISFWGRLVGAKTHFFWPTEWTVVMLDFLKNHPLHGRTR